MSIAGMPVDRRHAQEVACPTCLAPVGSPCQGRKGPRQSNHMERVTDYKLIVLGWDENTVRGVNPNKVRVANSMNATEVFPVTTTIAEELGF